MKIFAIIVSLVVLAAVVAAFTVVGSPSKQRAVRFDERRVNDLQSIQGQLIYHWQQKSALPASLAALNDSISGFVAPVDPETGAAYEYQVKSANSFELCANFKMENTSDSNGYPTKPMPYPGSYGIDNWSHGAGRVCVERTIDPELYKPIPVK